MEGTVRYRVTNFDAPTDELKYGHEEVVVEDEQIGDIKIRVMEVEHLDQLQEIADTNRRLEVHPCSISGCIGELRIWHEAPV